MNARRFLCLVLCLLPSATLRAQDPRERAPTSAELEQAIWIEGRVQFPDKTPADEKLQIVADASGFATFDKHLAPVEKDGHFRVAFAQDCARGRLRIQGRYLYLASDFAWKPGDATQGIVLEPALGCAILGRCGLSEKAKSMQSELFGQSVQLEGTPLRPGKNGIARVAWIRDDLTFEFGGLPDGFEFTLQFVSGPFVPVRIEELRLDRGGSQIVEVPIQKGATLRGTVVNEQGGPVAGALLAITCHGAGLTPPPRDVQDPLRRTDLDGRFEIRGIRPGKVTLWAKRDDLVSVNTEFADLKDGEVKEDVRVLLRLGNVLAGRAVFADGRPATGAKLMIVQSRGAELPAAQRAIVALQDGTFRATGLADGPVSIDARVDVREEGKKPRVFRALLADLAPAKSDLVITLEAGLSIEGRVTDDLGRAVQHFNVGAISAGAPRNAAGKNLTQDIRSADGTFTLDGVDKGDWDVYVYGKGVVYEPARRVAIPYVGKPLLFVLRRPAIVTGAVRGKNGEGITGAIVDIYWDRPSLVGATATTDHVSVKSGLDGRFEIGEVYPGTVRISARHDDGRKCDPTPIATASGETKSGVVLVIGS